MDKFDLVEVAYRDIGQTFLNMANNVTPQKVAEVEDGTAKAFFDAEWLRLLGPILPSASKKEDENGTHT